VSFAIGIWVGALRAEALESSSIYAADFTFSVGSQADVPRADIESAPTGDSVASFSTGKQAGIAGADLVSALDFTSILAFPTV